MDKNSPVNLSQILVKTGHNFSSSRSVKFDVGTVQCSDSGRKTAPTLKRPFSVDCSEIRGIMAGVGEIDKSNSHSGALDLTVPLHKSGIPEENLPRKKRRIEEIVENTTESQSECPQDLTVRSSRKSDRVSTPIKRNILGDKENNKQKSDSVPEKTETTLVNTLVAKAMKIWYDDDLPGGSLSYLMTSPIKNSPINLSMSKAISATRGCALDFDKPKDGTRSPRNKDGMRSPRNKSPKGLGGFSPNYPGAFSAHASFLQQATLRGSLAQQAAIAQTLTYSPDTQSDSSPAGHPYMKLKQMLHRKYANSLSASLDAPATVCSPSVASSRNPPAVPVTPTGKVSTRRESLNSSLNSSTGSPSSVDQSVVETSSGERLYRCNICFKAFTFSTNLTRHQRNIHGKPYRRRTKDLANKDECRSRSTSPTSHLPPKPAPEISVPPKGPMTDRAETLELKPDPPGGTTTEVQLTSKSQPNVESQPTGECDTVEKANDYLSGRDACSATSSAIDVLVCGGCGRDFIDTKQLDTHTCDSMNKVELEKVQPEKNALLSELVSTLNSTRKELTDDMQSLQSNSTVSCMEKRGDLTEEEEEEDENRLVIAEEESSIGHDGDLDPLPLLQETEFQVILPPKKALSHSHSVQNMLPNQEDDAIPVLPPGIPFPLPNFLPTIWPTVEPENQWRFKCFECGVAFPFWKGLSKHLRDVHQVGVSKDGATESKAEEEHKCKICGRIFTAAPNLRRHIKNVHIKEKQRTIDPVPQDGGAVCNLCGQTFLLPAHLAQHMRSMHALGKSSVDISRFDADQQPHTQPQEPKEADTAEAKVALAKMAMLPSPVDPAFNMVLYSQPLQQHFHYLKEALSRRMPTEDSTEKQNTSDTENQKPDQRRDIPFNLQEFILKKVVQEVTASPYAQENTAGKMPLCQDKNKLNTETEAGKENYPRTVPPARELGTMARGGFPAKSDGKRHICGLCGASFTFQTNLTRHQRKLHGKPYVRRGSTGIPTHPHVPTTEGEKSKTP